MSRVKGQRGWRRRDCVRLWCGSWDSGGGGSYHVAVVEYSSVDSNDESKGGGYAWVRWTSMLTGAMFWL